MNPLPKHPSKIKDATVFSVAQTIWEWQAVSKSVDAAMDIFHEAAVPRLEVTNSIIAVAIYRELWDHALARFLGDRRIS